MVSRATLKEGGKLQGTQDGLKERFHLRISDQEVRRYLRSQEERSVPSEDLTGELELTFPGQEKKLRKSEELKATLFLLLLSLEKP